MMSKDFRQQLKGFPCAFNMKHVNGITEARLNYIKNDVTKDDAHDYSKEEKMRDKNLLTWVEQRLGNLPGAIQLNEEVLRETNDSNLSALASRIYLYKDDKEKRENYLKNLENVDDLLTEAYAEQAYYYSRLGGFRHYKLSIELYNKAIQKCPNRYLWIFGLGLVNRRLSYFHMQAFYPTGDVEKYVKDADKLLLQVAKAEVAKEKVEKAEVAKEEVAKEEVAKEEVAKEEVAKEEVAKEEVAKEEVAKEDVAKEEVAKEEVAREEVAKEEEYIKLKCKAYSQLAVLYSNNAKELDKTDKEKKEEITSFVQKVLENKYDLKKKKLLTPSVLDQCALAQKDFKREESIKLFEESIAIKPTSKAHLDLAKCILNKIKLLLNVNRDQKNQFTENEKEIYKSALENCQKSYTISNETYVPALLTSLKLCIIFKDVDKARQFFEQIIDNENTHVAYLHTLRDAHDIVSQHQDYLKMNNEHKTKAISLAADLLSSNRNLNECKQRMWQSVLHTSTEKVDNAHCDFFINLVGNHIDVEVVQDFLKHMFDFNHFQDTLKKYLNSNASENALAFLNLAKTHFTRKRFKKKDFQDLSERTYLLASRNRLVNETKDYKRPLQQMFKSVYGHCNGDQWDQSGYQKGDVLLVNEGSQDAMTLCSNLKLVFDIVCGLDANIISWANWTIPEEDKDIILEEMKTFSVVIIVLGQSSSEFESMLNKTSVIKDVEFRVIKLQEQCQVPEALQICPRFEVTDLGLHYDGHVKPDRASILEMFNDQFNGVIKLFKFVMKERRHESSAGFTPCGKSPSAPPGDATPVEADRKRRRRRRRGKRRKASGNK